VRRRSFLSLSYCPSLLLFSRRAAIVPVIEVGENAWTLTTVHDTSPQPPPLTAPTIASPRYT
jgi:hypothetical protein